MSILTKTPFLGAALLVAACSGGPFENTVGLGNNRGDDAFNSEFGDENSPSYFQQAVGDRVFFTVDQSSLTDQAMVILDNQAVWLADNPDYNAIIEGHADEQGTREYNLALGAERANAVRDYLISRGIPGDRMRTVSYGKERPVEICSEESCYALNRRSVTIISLGLSG